MWRETSLHSGSDRRSSQVSVTLMLECAYCNSHVYVCMEVFCDGIAHPIVYVGTQVNFQMGTQLVMISASDWNSEGASVTMLTTDQRDSSSKLNTPRGLLWCNSTSTADTPTLKPDELSMLTCHWFMTTVGVGTYYCWRSLRFSLIYISKNFHWRDDICCMLAVLLYRLLKWTFDSLI